MKFELAKKLNQKKYRQQSGYCLLEGEHLLDELEKSSLQDVELWLTPDRENWDSRFTKHIISERQMSQLSDTRSPQGMIASVSMVEMQQAATSRSAQHSGSSSQLKTLYLFEIQDPGNLGTILRSLAWFGGWRCLLSPGSVDPYNGKVIRSSMGAILNVPIELDVPLEQLPERFGKIATLDMKGSPIQDASFQNFDCYLFGNEARGVPQQQADQMQLTRFTIPSGSSGSPGVESLNLGTAVSTCVYELSRP
ncbi:MAG: TrmH family RNA methyltransferase [Oceanobacter sp.]